MKQNKVKLCDASTGASVEVIVSPSGKLFHVEGFSEKLVKEARKAAVSYSNKKGPAPGVNS